jgi:hypothetical protein
MGRFRGGILREGRASGVSDHARCGASTAFEPERRGGSQGLSTLLPTHPELEDLDGLSQLQLDSRGTSQPALRNEDVRKSCRFPPSSSSNGGLHSFGSRRAHPTLYRSLKQIGAIQAGGRTSPTAEWIGIYANLFFRLLRSSARVSSGSGSGVRRRFHAGRCNENRRM